MNRLAAIVLVALTLSTAHAADHVFMLSGGGNPGANHYSQYLQTQTMTYELRKILGDSRVDVRFGAGNNEANPRLLSDVHKATELESGQKIHDMRFGVITGNAPATKDGALEYFKGLEKSSGLSAKDTFFLIVSDHGEPNRAE